MEFEAPIVVADGGRVRKEWIDYNGHMNVAFYVLAFDLALDVVYERMGLGEPYRERTDHTTFSLEGHTHWLREVRENDPMRFTTRLLDWDAKRLHFYMEMFHADEGYLASTYEMVTMHINLAERRGAPFPQDLQDVFRAVHDSQKDLPTPQYVGTTIGIRRK
jgi:acyl-CoA thioester hydrolase